MLLSPRGPSSTSPLPVPLQRQKQVLTAALMSLGERNLAGTLKGCREEGTEMIYFPGNWFAPLDVELLLGWELDHTGL